MSAKQASDYQREIKAIQEEANVKIASLKEEAKAQRRAELFEKNKEARQREEALKARLEDEHGLREHPKRELLWSKAWDLGHSYGLSEVENYYADLAELLQDGKR